MIKPESNQDSMMTQREAAEYISQLLNVPFRTVYDRYPHLPGFPHAVLLPTTGNQARKRFHKKEIVAWVEGLQRIT